MPQRRIQIGRRTAKTSAAQSFRASESQDDFRKTIAIQQRPEPTKFANKELTGKLEILLPWPAFEILRVRKWGQSETLEMSLGLLLLELIRVRSEGSSKCWECWIYSAQKGLGNFWVKAYGTNCKCCFHINCKSSSESRDSTHTLLQGRCCKWYFKGLRSYLKCGPLGLPEVLPQGLPRAHPSHQKHDAIDCRF